MAKEILKIFHVDSWECGSQNWSPLFASEFIKRRGYDLMPFLLTMVGVPVGDAATSEKVLHDVRQTIADLVNDVFYKTLNGLAREKGCSFSAESVAPTMVSDGLLHYKNIIQAEAFTTLRMNWGEHPGNLKALGDRNFALGINRMVMHVFMHNPWLNRKPGVTLDALALYTK